MFYKFTTEKDLPDLNLDLNSEEEKKPLNKNKIKYYSPKSFQPPLQVNKWKSIDNSSLLNIMSFMTIAALLDLRRLSKADLTKIDAILIEAGKNYTHSIQKIHKESGGKNKEVMFNDLDKLSLNLSTLLYDKISDFIKNERGFETKKENLKTSQSKFDSKETLGLKGNLLLLMSSITCLLLSAGTGTYGFYTLFGCSTSNMRTNSSMVNFDTYNSSSPCNGMTPLGAVYLLSGAVMLSFFCCLFGSLFGCFFISFSLLFLKRFFDLTKNGLAVTIHKKIEFKLPDWIPKQLVEFVQEEISEEKQLNIHGEKIQKDAYTIGYYKNIDAFFKKKKTTILLKEATFSTFSLHNGSEKDFIDNLLNYKK